MTTDPRVAAIAVDLGLQLGSDLGPPLRRPGEPVRLLPLRKEAVAKVEIAAETGAAVTTAPAPLVPLDPETLIEDAPPTSWDWRRAKASLGWHAVYIAGAAQPIPAAMQGLELWPVCLGLTDSPHNVKSIQQTWSLGFRTTVHGLLWCDSERVARRLKDMLTDALDYRLRHLAGRYYNIAPRECEALALEVARMGRITTHDEAERQRRLQETVAEALKRIGRR